MHLQPPSCSKDSTGLCFLVASFLSHRGMFLVLFLRCSLLKTRERLGVFGQVTAQGHKHIGMPTLDSIDPW